MVALARNLSARNLSPIGALIGVLGDMDVSQVEYACIINVCIYRCTDSTGSTIYVCTHACMYVLCMYACIYERHSARHSARRSLIGALCGIDVSQVRYAYIENVCIYRRADSTASTIYVCMHACMYVLCMYVLQSARHSAGRSLIGALIGALCGIDASQVKYARIENVCICSKCPF